MVDGCEYKLELLFLDGRYQAAVDGGIGKGSYGLDGQRRISGLDGDGDLGRYRCTLSGIASSLIMASLICINTDIFLITYHQHYLFHLPFSLPLNEGKTHFHLLAHSPNFFVKNQHQGSPRKNKKRWSFGLHKGNIKQYFHKYWQNVLLCFNLNN